MLKDDTIEVRITGSGPNTWVYAISDKTYEQLAKNDDNDDPIEIIKSDYVEGSLVCWGLDIDQFTNFSLEIIINGKSQRLESKVVNIDGYVNLKEACESAGIGQEDIVLEYNSAKADLLGDTFKLGKSKHLIFETTTFTTTVLKATIPSLNKFDEKDLTLLIRSMDVDTALSKAFYGLKISEGMEQDIIGIFYKSERYLFECSSSGGSNTEYLIANLNGKKWEFDHYVSLIRFNF